MTRCGAPLQALLPLVRGLKPRIIDIGSLLGGGT
jgi:hypothetical protein